LRLNIYLQRAGVGSRREAERLVAEGLVEINGTRAKATTPVSEADQVKVRGKPVSPGLFKLYKPLDVICTTRDHQGRQTIFDLDSLKKRGLPRLMNVGRLDINSEGLLLMSSDGPLAQAMMNPANELPRVYRVRARGRLKPEDLARLAKGVTIAGIRYRGAEITEEKAGEGVNRWYRVTIREGKNREVRKLMEHFGCIVNRLIRVQYGPVLLGPLKPGALEEIEPSRVKQLMLELSRSGAISP
jgi:23S rRNA pseudouridine2605 synthase